MPLFTMKKKENPTRMMPPPMPSAPLDTPIDKVFSMRQQGLTNNQIIQNLQRLGYDSDQIFNAINQADIKGGVANTPINDFSQETTQAIRQPPMQTSQSSEDYGSDRDRIEEVAEAIIDEKWDELVKNINKIIEWKNKSDTRLSSLEQQFTDLKNDFDKLHQAVIGKIGEYDQNILNVGTEIKVMEKVFQKVLPTLTENVNELSRITKDFKKPVSKK